jgi:ketosteroid isomerase-like protein
MSLAATRRQWIVSAAVLVCIAVFARTTTAQSSAMGSEQQLKAAHQQMVNAAMKGDKDTVAGLVADNLTWVSSDGKLMNKDDMLGGLPAPVRELADQQFRLTGSSAVVTGVAHLNNGPDVRFLQQWISRGGKWQLVAHETTLVTAPQSEASPTGTAGSTSTGMTRESMAPTLTTDEERAVWQVQTQLTDAFLKGDSAVYAKLTGDDYVRVVPGKMLAKTEFLQTVKANAKQSAGHLESNDVRITVDGDTARVVMANWGQLPGGEASPPSRVTRIFQKRHGQWQQVAAIFAPIVDKQE